MNQKFAYEFRPRFLAVAALKRFAGRAVIGQTRNSGH